VLVLVLVLVLLALVPVLPVQILRHLVNDNSPRHGTLPQVPGAIARIDAIVPLPAIRIRTSLGRKMD